VCWRATARGRRDRDPRTDLAAASETIDASHTLTTRDGDKSTIRKAGRQKSIHSFFLPSWIPHCLQQQIECRTNQLGRRIAVEKLLELRPASD
jgi:hypothetical protein